MPEFYSLPLRVTSSFKLRLNLDLYYLLGNTFLYCNYLLFHLAQQIVEGRGAGAGFMARPLHTYYSITFTAKCTICSVPVIDYSIIPLQKPVKSKVVPILN
jgi:hypothetical protein